MSGSIGRSYLIQQWNDASSYSGEMIGNRLSKSTELYLKNGKANTALFADEEPQQPKKKPIKEQIIPASATLDKLDTQERELYRAFEAEEISIEDFEQCIHALEIKRQRAWRSYVKHAGISEENDYPVYTDQEIKNAVLHGVFPKEKACFDGHSGVCCKPMNTAVFISLVLVASVILLIIAN